MDDSPGVSLFQGNEIQLNGSIQREEEEEALDARRRNEEIQNVLSTAFDELSVDEYDDDDDEDECDDFKSNSGIRNSGRQSVSRLPVYQTHKYSSSQQREISSYSNGDASGNDSFNISYETEKILQQSIPQNLKSEITDNNKPRKQRYHYTLTSGHDSGVSEDQHVSSLATLAANNSKNAITENRPSSPHLQHCYRRMSSGGKGDITETVSPSVAMNQIYSDRDQREAYINSRYNSMGQLQILYDVRLKEIQSLKEQLETERTNSAALKDDLTRKVMLAEADKERVLLSYKQTSELLVWSKGKTADLEREVSTLKQNIENLERSRSENMSELETARGMLTELQQRLAFAERTDGSKQMEKQLESSIKSLQSKHLQEVTSLTQKLESCNIKLKQKDDEIRALEERLLDLQTKLSCKMVEQSDTVTSLMRDLENSQAQCRQLMATNMSCDKIKLQQQMDELIKERIANNKELTSLKAECNSLRSDLEQLESFAQFGLSPVSESDSMVQLGLASKNGSGGKLSKCCDSHLYLSDNMNKLKDELHRALLGQKAKRGEIERLREKLHKRENQIEDMKRQESVYKVEVETVKDNMSKLFNELKKSRQSEKIEKVEIEVQTSDFIGAELEKWQRKVDEIKSEKESLKQKLMETEKLLKETQEKLALVETEKENKTYDLEEEIAKRVQNQLESKEIEYKVAIDQKSKECNELKELYIQLRTSKEQRNKQLEAEKEARHSLNTQLETLTQQIENYKSQIAIKDELLTKYKTDNEELLSELNKLRNDSLGKINYNEVIAKKEKECAILKEEIKSNRNWYSDELERLKKELEGSKERVLLLEKNLRTEFTNEVNKYRLEINALRSTLDDKEVDLQDTKEKLKLHSSNAFKVDKDVMTDPIETFDSDFVRKLTTENKIKVQQISEHYSAELKSCIEDCAKKVDTMERLYKEALGTVSKKEEELDKAEEKYKKLISVFQKQLAEQEQTLKANYLAEVADAEEKIKELTVKYFAEEIKKLEAQHRVEIETINRHANTSSVEKLQKLLVAKDLEIDNLQSTYVNTKSRIVELENQIEKDRDNTAELMTRWSKEVQTLRSELVNKEKTLKEMIEKMKKTKKAALYFKQELQTHKSNTATLLKRNQFMLLQQLQDKIDKAFEANSNDESKQIEEQYLAKEHELKRKLNR